MSAKMPTCNWCNKTIAPSESFVVFQCPNCSGVTLIRCHRCREFGRPYKCPKCGFQGP